MVVGDRAGIDTGTHITAAGMTATPITVIAVADMTAVVAVGVVTDVTAMTAVIMISDMTMAAIGEATPGRVIAGKTTTSTVTNRSAPRSPKPVISSQALQTVTPLITGG
jgi:hypothetical protein